LIQKPNKNDWLTILQLVFSVLAILGFWALAVALLIFGVFGLVIIQAGRGGNLPLYLFSAACAAIGILLVPSAVYSFNRAAGRKYAFRFSDWWRLRPPILIFALPAVLLLGHLAAQYDLSSLVFLPFFHIIAVGLPILWFLYLGVRGLPLGSKQRQWGVFASGLVLGPFLIMLAEFILLGVVILAGVIFLINQPEMINELLTNIGTMVNSGADPDQIVSELGPYIVNPKILFLVFLFAALIVPLVEEALKPIGVWLLINRSITPAEGFAAGVISGAGYAFFESVALTSTAEEWTLVVVARIGTAVIHMFTAGLMGWAMAFSWRHGNYIRLGLTYLGVVCLHGLWNGLTLLMMLAFFVEEYHPGSDISFRMPGVGAIAPLLLGMLSFAAFLALLWVNGYLSNNKGDGELESIVEG
jgi:hypothetical protein